MAADVPAPFRGVSIAMVTAGLMSLVFMGFAGLIKIYNAMIHILLPFWCWPCLPWPFGITRLCRRQFHVQADPIVDQLDALLPQCSVRLPGCKPYAEALANGDKISKCVPGGDATMRKIADLMGVEPQPWTAVKTRQSPSRRWPSFTKTCVHRLAPRIQACPVDAILGATKAMHTVIAAECTGATSASTLPDRSIEMIPVPTTVDN